MATLRKRFLLLIALYLVWVWRRHQLFRKRVLASKERKPITETTQQQNQTTSTTPSKTKDEKYCYHGYSPEGKVYFMIEINISQTQKMVGTSIYFVINRIQHCLKAKRDWVETDLSAFSIESSLPLSIGPVSVQVIDSNQIRITINENNHGLSGELTFMSRETEIIQPSYVRESFNESKSKGVTINQKSRSQCGWWNGTAQVSSENVQLIRFPGFMENTTGCIKIPSLPFSNNISSNFVLRSLASLALDFVPQDSLPQLHLTKCSSVFDDFWVVYGCFETADGKPEYKFAASQRLGDEEVGNFVEMRSAGHAIHYMVGTRQPRFAEIYIEGESVHSASRYITMRITPLCPLYSRDSSKSRKGISGESFKVDNVDKSNVIDNAHVYILCQVELADKVALGVFEHFSIGPYLPSGFVHLLDTK